MPSLAEAQSVLAAALADPDRGIPVDFRGAGFCPPGRFDMHRNNFVSGLVGVLAAVYPAVMRLVGEPFFRSMARGYVLRHPPRSPVLIQYGDDFPAFIDGFSPAGSVPYLGDVARLEWAWTKAYHAADADPMALSALAEVPSRTIERLVFQLHPSLSVLRSKWPVASIWSATVGGADPAGVNLGQSEDVLVLRPGGDVAVHASSAEAAAFVSHLADRASLGDAAAATSAGYPGFDLARHLVGLFAIGAVTNFAPGEAVP